MGFEMASEFDGIAYFKSGSCSFLLQNFYEPAHEDVQSWYTHVLKLNLDKEFGVKVTELIEQPWGMQEGFPTLGIFASTSNLVVTVQCFRLGGGVAHPLIGRYISWRCSACLHPLTRRYVPMRSIEL